MLDTNEGRHKTAHPHIMVIIVVLVSIIICLLFSSRLADIQLSGCWTTSDLNGTSNRFLDFHLWSSQLQDTILQVGRDLVHVDIITESHTVIELAFRESILVLDLAATAQVQDVVFFQLNVHVLRLDTRDIDRNSVRFVIFMHMVVRMTRISQVGGTITSTFALVVAATSRRDHLVGKDDGCHVKNVIKGSAKEKGAESVESHFVSCLVDFD